MSSYIRKPSMICGSRSSFLVMNKFHEDTRSGSFLDQFYWNSGHGVKANFGDNPATFGNTCALRLSYALNK
jgi:hypothetical protein